MKSNTVCLLLGVHAHQPVGNFTEVLEDAHLRCYRPFLHTLHRYPNFRFAIHFSGWLLDHLNRVYPEDMRLLHEMVERGQAELFGGGDTEPVLAVIPERDRLGQLQALSHRLERTLGERPTGAWLTERVWEATVVPALHDAAIQYVTVDDYHFLCAGKDAAELNGYFTTEEDGKRLDLFPISEELRYRLPFSPAQEVVAYLERLADQGACDAAAIYFDDIEKFGIWPETYEWVYEKGWLTQFIEGVLASPKIRTVRYGDYHAATRSRGVVYLPTTSYIEMNEWTLPAPRAHRFADLVAESRAAGRFEQDKPYIRGGIWKNFFMRYAESNWMHKRMLQLSRRLADLPARKRKAEHYECLYEAQANDAYWHGLFGGLYLPHLRRAVYHGIVRLERALDQLEDRPACLIQDLDMDGQSEVFLHNASVQAVVRLNGLGSVCELDAYQLGQNFGDTLRRRDEHYYRKMHLQASQHSGSGIASAHDRISFKHEILPQDLQLDLLPRDSWLDSLLLADGRTLDITDYTHDAPEPGKAALVLKSSSVGLDIVKRYRVAGKKLVVDYRLKGQLSGSFRTTLNLAMPSCDGPAGRFVQNGVVLGGFGQPLGLSEMTEIQLLDDVLGGRLVLRSSVPVALRSYPYFTVSQSEAGFEKIMQAVCIELVWGATSKIIEFDLEFESDR